MKVKAVDLANAAGKSRAYISAETKREHLFRNDNGIYDLENDLNKSWIISKGIKKSDFKNKKQVLVKSEKNSNIKSKPVNRSKEIPKNNTIKCVNETDILLESIIETINKIYPDNSNNIQNIKNEIYKTFKKNLEEQKNNIIPEYFQGYKKLTKFIDAQYARVGEVENIGIPTKENQQFRFVTKSAMNVISFLIYLIEKLDYIDECILSYYVIGIKTIELLDALLESGKIKKLYIQTSTIRLSGKDAKSGEAIKNLIKKYGKKRVSGNAAWIHTKILCCKIKDNYYVIEGSGNLSDNARIEQYVFEKSKQSFDFHKKWIENVSELSTEKDVVLL